MPDSQRKEISYWIFQSLYKWGLDSGMGTLRLTIPICVSEAKPVTRTDVARVTESSRLSGHPVRK